MARSQTHHSRVQTREEAEVLSRFHPRRFFLDHLAEKGFSLILATVIIWLIGRELRQELFEGPCRLVLHTEATGELGDVIVVAGEATDGPGYALRLAPGARARVTISGPRKLRQEITRPLRLQVLVRAGRFAGVQEEAWSRIELDGDDLRLPGFAGLRIETSAPFSVEASRLVERELPLEPRFPDGDARFEGKLVQGVDFDPKTVLARGPGPVLRELVALPVRVHLRSVEQTIESELIALEGVQLVEPQRARARLLTERRAETIVFEGVRLRFVIGTDQRYVPALSALTRDAGGVLPVRLTGPKSAVDAIRADEKLYERLRDQLEVLVFVEDAEGGRTGPVPTADPIEVSCRTRLRALPPELEGFEEEEGTPLSVWLRYKPQ